MIPLSPIKIFLSFLWKFGSNSNTIICFICILLEGLKNIFILGTWEKKREGNTRMYSRCNLIHGNALSLFAFIISLRMLVFHIFCCTSLFLFNSIFGIFCFMPPLFPWYLVFPTTCLSLINSCNLSLSRYSSCLRLDSGPQP